MAAQLLETVAARSSGSWDGSGGARAQADALQRRLTMLAQENARAYEAARATLEAGSDEERRHLGQLLDRAANVPCRIAEAAADTATLAAEAAERAEPGARPDAAVAALMADAAVRAAVRLIEVNLATTPSDARLARARECASESARAAERAGAAAA
jgi:formiminotetrahydrofolate cyclodeaminase